MGLADGSVPPNETVKRYDTREVVAPAVNMSTATYSRANLREKDQGQKFADSGLAALAIKDSMTPCPGDRQSRFVVFEYLRVQFDPFRVGAPVTPS